MAAEYFNSLGGFSVGLPEVPVIDANGNVITNVLTNGNVFANVVYATYFRWANGQPFNASAGGSNTQLQYNNNGSIAGIPNVTWNGNTLNLGNVTALNIGGGLNGYFLQTDGAGNLTWAAGGGGGGNGSPGGANTQIKFNNAGTFGGDPGFTYDSITNTLDVINVVATGEVDLGSVSYLTITGGIAGYYLRTDGTGNLVWDLPGGGGNGTPGGSNTQVQFNDEGEFSGQAGFTFSKDTGILTIPIVSANAVSANGFQTTGNLSAGNIRVTTLANIPGALRVTGNVNTSGSANINLGIVSNIHISGGTNGAVLTTDGLGNLSWQEGGGGGNGTPGGSNTQIQFNNNGLFGGSPFLTFNNSTNTVQVAGNLIANTFQMGAGVYQFSTSEVYFATTASTSPNQVLYSIPTDDISGVEFHIIATDAIGGTRQSSKISSVVYNGQVQFNEYAGLYINGGVGTLQVDYNAGSIINPPSLELKVTPDSSNQTVYKMLITVFAS
jgi:hypothetical protein